MWSILFSLNYLALFQQPFVLSHWFNWLLNHESLNEARKMGVWNEVWSKIYPLLLLHGIISDQASFLIPTFPSETTIYNQASSTIRLSLTQLYTSSIQQGSDVFRVFSIVVYLVVLTKHVLIFSLSYLVSLKIFSIARET